MRMRRWLWSAGLLTVVGLGTGHAHGEPKQARAQAEEVGETFARKVRFADQLSLLNEEQIVLGHIALRQSKDPEVRRFAEDLIRDHQRNLDDLETLARSKALSPATVELSRQDMAIGGSGLEGAQPSLEKVQEAYNKQYDQQVMEFLEKSDALAGLSGSEFDKAFLAEVERGQKRGERLIAKGLDDFRDDTPLTAFLGGSAPVLDSHQRRLETLRGARGD